MNTLAWWWLFLAAAPAASGVDDQRPATLLRQDVLADPAAHRILEGWIDASGGEAWLGVEFVDENSRVLARHVTPPVPAGAGWTYTAVETEPLKPLPGATRFTARLLLHARGDAKARDVRLSPFSPRVLANGDMEAPLDRRGRIPLWSEEKDDAVVAGKREGSHQLDVTKARGGKASLLISTTADSYAVSSINYPVPKWSDRFEAAAWALVEGDAQARVHAVWAGDYGSPILRVDSGPPAAGPSGAWQRLSTGPLEPPAGATVLRIALSVTASTSRQPPAASRFDDADLVTHPPSRQIVIVTVNQVGYESKGPKSAVVLTGSFPRGACAGSLEILDANGGAVLRRPLLCSGRIRGEKDADWGWYFWRADFSACEEPGAYRVRASIGGADGVSYPFAIGSDLLFRETAPSVVDFFFVQRCGFAVPGWHGACHLDDAKLPDGTRRDLSGGWHSAGDYNKITWEYGDGGVAYALARAAEAAVGVLGLLDRDGDGLADVLDEAWWGAKYLAKLQSPETGAFLKDIQQGPDRQSWMRWVPPEKQTDNVSGTADDPIVLESEGHSPLAIGGWARLGRLLAARGVKTDFLERARRSWERRATDPAALADPLLLLSALDLHDASGDARLREFALLAARRILFTDAAPPDAPPVATEQPRIRGGYGDSGDVPAAALALCALRFPDEPIAREIRAALAGHLDRLAAAAANPFGVTKQKADRAGEEGHFFEPSSVYGQNFLFGCRAWSALCAYRLLKDRRALEYATDQLDFLLGKNPYNLCMFEGKGSFNPPRYHHRYDSIPGRERGAVPGAIPNGFVRDSGSYDRPGFDLSTRGRDHPSYRTSEPWLVHDVLYLLAITELYQASR